MNNFTELHGHSEYSNLRLIDCVIKAEDYVKYAFNIGLAGVAITDHESLSGHLKALKAYNEIKKENPESNFKLILGNEIYLVDRAKEQKDDKIQYYHFVLLAKNNTGHKAIRKLSSRAWENSYYDRRVERVPTLKSWLSEVKELKGNVIASTACLGSEFAQLVLSLDSSEDENDHIRTKNAIHDFVNWGMEVFGKDDFYIELQSSDSEEQVQYNHWALKIAKAYGLKHIITNDVHYLKKENYEIHTSFLKSKEEERETSDFYENTYFKTSEEIVRKMEKHYSLDDIETGIANTMDIHKKIEGYDLFHEIIVPTRELESFKLKHIFKNWYDKCEYIRECAYGDSKQNQYLLYKLEEGFVKLNEKFNDGNVERINIELQQILETSEKLGQDMSSYYTLTQWLVDIMWDDELGNSFVGVARGSVTGFYTCFLLEIIQINPIEYGLPYWRHLNKERITMPDIDLDSEANRRPFIFDSIKQKVGYDNALNIATFKTEGSKSAILTACRGLGIDIDTAEEIASMIPSERGILWSLKDCIDGNEEKGREPIKQFVDIISQYPNLEDTATSIEGLVTSRSSHASGFYIFNNGYVEQNALMKTPSGQLITQFNMEDSDEMGGLKVDFLTIKALDKMRKTFNWLLEDKLIEWQGSLRKTYNKYLHPSAIDFTYVDMWDKIREASVIDLFQFETLMGSKAIRLLQPENIVDMAKGNSAMRLMADEGESPLEIFARYKKDISQWYSMAKDYGLDEFEIGVLEEHLSQSYMLAIEQEDIMELSMDSRISGFNLIMADTLRKAVAKKKPEVMKQVKEEFFKHGIEIGTREVFLNFVWDKCIMLQAGYSFSKNHTTPYSVIGIQEAWLASKYHKTYWNTGCLTVNSGSSQDEEFGDSKKQKTTQYGKIAKAISGMMSRGVEVALPNINKANFEFTPDPANNRIIFGLKGISHVGDDLANSIIENRPYSSIHDFYDKVAPSKVNFLYIIKSGAFDELHKNTPREQIMEMGLSIIAKSETQDKIKTSLNMQNFNSVVELDLLEEEDKIFIRYWRFKAYIFKNCFKGEKVGRKLTYWLDELAEPFFLEHFAPKLVSDSDYWVEKGKVVFYKSSFEKIYKEFEQDIKDKMNSHKFIDKYNETLYNVNISENKSKYCQGTISQWEMESISYYHSEHELAHIDKEQYLIQDFSSLPEQPVYTLKQNKNGRTWKKYEISRICGTVLDVDKTKHIVYLLTTDGVVNVRFHDGAFVHYNKTISETYFDEQSGKNKKQTIEQSWFKRGSKLIITGFRREDYFNPRKYRDSIYSHTVARINKIYESGRIEIQSERERV